MILCLSHSVVAQEYIRVTDDEVIYDVEVIVFSRQLLQPEAETMNNALSVKTEDVLILPQWDREIPLVVDIESPTSSDSEWEVPLNEEKEKQQKDVLSWIILENEMNHPIIDKLRSNPTINPLFRQKWRQPASAFLQPQYVEISQLDTKEELTNDVNFLTQSNMIKDNIYTDNSIDGQVAFSEQRFTHLHIKMNLFRINDLGEQIVYKIAQQKRIELDEWQYFDHQQMGVLAKVTAVNFSLENES